MKLILGTMTFGESVFNPDVEEFIKELSKQDSGFSITRKNKVIHLAKRFYIKPGVLVPADIIGNIGHERTFA